MPVAPRLYERTDTRAFDLLDVTLANEMLRIAQQAGLAVQRVEHVVSGGAVGAAEGRAQGAPGSMPDAAPGSVNPTSDTAAGSANPTPGAALAVPSPSAARGSAAPRPRLAPASAGPSLVRVLADSTKAAALDAVAGDSSARTMEAWMWALAPRLTRDVVALVGDGWTAEAELSVELALALRADDMAEFAALLARGPVVVDAGRSAAEIVAANVPDPALIHFV